MSLAFKKAKVYTKTVLFMIVGVAVASVLIMNRGDQHTVSVWFFWLTDSGSKVNVVWVMLWTAVASIITWQVILATLSLIKEARALRRQEELKKAEAVQAERERRLDERERRIDEKVADSLSQETDDRDRTS